MNRNSTQMESLKHAQSKIRAMMQLDCHSEQASFARGIRGQVALVCLWLFLSGTQMQAPAQKEEAHIHVIVDLVQLNVAVTDNKGDYITGLRPQDFQVTEDGIPQKLATFAEGNEPSRRLVDVSVPEGKLPAVPETQAMPAQASGETLGVLTAGANVFILFDTSNYMYRGFVFAQDAIADFVRSLENADKVAFYSYSRNLSREAALTADRSAVLRGVRTTVAGDDAALYNCLLLTVKDAAQFTGRKVVVVFSNGPDNASMVPPEDVAELAQSTGIPIYMISTQQARLEPVSTAVFDRMTAATGGKVYFAKNWKEERRAFSSIRDDLAHLYALSYYPQANPNTGWRAITVKLVGDRVKNYHIRTRNGYRPQPARFSPGGLAAASSQSAP
jgi:Ca-activated chloride channel homolog